MRVVPMIPPVVAGTLALVGLLPLAAQQPSVTDVHMSAAPAAPATFNFPSGVRSVYLAFTYRDLTNHEVRAVVRDSSGNILFESSQVYSGTGVEELEISSEAAIRGLFAGLSADASSLIAAVDSALASVADPVVRHAYVQSGLTLIGHMGVGLATLNRAGLPLGAASSLQQAQTYLAQASSDGRAAQGASDIGSATVYLQRMKANAQSAAAALKDAELASAGGTYSFPDTVACQPYLSNVYLNGRVVGSVEWSVGAGQDSYIQLRATQTTLIPGAPGLNVTTIHATVLDGQCQPPPDGVAVSFSLAPPGAGQVSPSVDYTRSGAAQTILFIRDDFAGGPVTVMAEALGRRGTIQLAVLSRTVLMSLSPATSSLQPGGSLNLLARVSQPDGTPVPDGVVVTFRLEPDYLGSLRPTAVGTRGGMASVTFTAGTAHGLARVVARAMGVEASAQVGIGVAPPTATPGSQPPPPPMPTTPPQGLEPPACSSPREPNAVCNAVLSVRVYKDYDCNRRFEAGRDRAMANIPLTIRYPNGATQVITTASSGYARLSGIVLRGSEVLVVEPSLPSGSRACYNSHTRLQLDRTDFQPFSYMGASFRVSD